MKQILIILPALLLLGCGGGGSSQSGVQSTIEAEPVLPVPVGASLTQATQTSLSFQWEAVAGAVDYRVTRDTQPLIVAEETQLRFRDTGLTPRKVYNFSIEALGPDGTLLRRMTVSGVTKSGVANLTQADEPPADVTRARSLTTFGWTPNPLYDSCPKWLHDSFWTFGPDNKAYPTWHPPVYEYADGTLCRFGHEHGQDQRESRLFGTVGPIPFGYVNEQLSPGDPNFQRNEDHFGHKVALFNGLKNIVMTGGTESIGTMECDVLFKLHQGTHSADALKNNSHERFLNYKCPNGLEIRFKSLQAFGSPNTFTNETNNMFSRVVQTSGASPSNQPTGASRRIIPSLESMAGYLRVWGGASEVYRSNCDNCAGTAETQAELRTLGYAQPYYTSMYNGETWQGGPTLMIKPENSAEVLFKFEGGPYWNLLASSRYYEPGSATLIARQIDLCFNSASQFYTSMDCKLARSRGKGARVAWDSPLSPFNGAVRFNEVNFIALYNPSPQRERVFFTPFGLTQLVGTELPLARSATYPIRGYFKSTGTQTLNVQLSNWAGSAQCGGSACYTNFNFYKLKSGIVVDAGVHAPN